MPYLVLRYPQKLKNKKPPGKDEIVQFYGEMLRLLEFAYNDSVITVEEYNVILEAMKEAEQRIFKDYADIKQEVDGMVSDTLELKSIKMRDEAVREATLDSIETFKQLGVKFSEEQMQELLKRML